MIKFKSILDSEYIEPTRPYSTKELLYLKNLLYENLSLSKYKVSHTKCGHFYHIRKNSRKEKEIKEIKEIKEEEIKEENLIDIGNCSICWKIYKTPRYLKEKAKNMTEYYLNNFSDDELKYDYNLLDLETIFYKWLYLENYDDNKKDNKKENKREIS